MPPPPEQRESSPSRRIHQLAGQLGFAHVGIAPAEPTQHQDYIRDWLTLGRHGSMTYLEKHLASRLDVRALVPEAKSVICLADRHETRAEPNTNEDSPRGRIARYAWGEDYHKVIKKRLHQFTDALREVWPDHVFRAAVDTAGILERDLAFTAGLGWIGKNTMLIHPEMGSYLLLGEIITSMDLSDDGPAATEADHCGTCTRCLDTCPTQCLEPYRMDASRCISYLTIEHREAIPPELHEAMGDWVAGCDVCQEVCPYNQTDRVQAMRPPALRDEYHPRPPSPDVPLSTLLDWNADMRQKSLTRSALKRIKLEQWKRNALIAAGNWLRQHENPSLHRRIEALSQDAEETELVRETARQVLADLSTAP